MHDGLNGCDCRDVHDGLVQQNVLSVASVKILIIVNVMHLMTVLTAMSIDGLKGTVSPESTE